MSSMLPALELEFAGQLVHSALPTTSLYVPSGHASHGPLMGPVYPLSHSPLAPAALEPATQSAARSLDGEEAESGGQLRHAELPGASLYFPASHASHVCPSGPVKPPLHMQEVDPVLAIGEKELSGQAEHAELPSASLNVPSGQALQGPPIGPVYPTLHSPFTLGSLVPDTQSAGRLLAGWDSELSGHPVHEPLPLESLYVPESHA